MLEAVGARPNPTIAALGLSWVKATRAPLRKGYYSFDLASIVCEQADAIDASIIHVHSLWCYPALAAYGAAKAGGRRLVLSPRSELYPLSMKRSGALKAVFRRLFANRLLGAVDLMHATEPAEAKAIRALGISAPIVIVPNGVDLSIADDLPQRDAAKRLLGIAPGRRCLLYLARLHPRKGPERLLRAWRKSGLAENGWDCVIAGVAESARYASALRAAGKGTGTGAVHWLGHVEGARKQHTLAACDIFVLPSLFENFGISIAEALACARPVVTTDGTPWQSIAREEAGRIVPVGDDSALAGALRAIADLSDAERAAMGQRGRAIVQDMTWDSAASCLAGAYAWCVGDPGAAPTFHDSST